MFKKRSIENFEKVGKSKFSKKNFAQISSGNNNYAKFSVGSMRLFAFGVFCLVLVGLFFVSGVVAEESGDSSSRDSNEGADFAVEDFPIETEGEKIIESFEMNPQTGLPKKYEDFKKNAEEFHIREQNQSFLWKEWTKILADKPVIGPIMFYTNNVFSFFNPVWKYSFGLEFAWSVAFFLSFILWVVLIILIYYPVGELSDNKLIGIIVSVVMACLAGAGGGIEGLVVFLTPLLTNFISFLLAMIVVYFLMKLYMDFMKGRQEESRKREVERAESRTITLGSVSGRGLRGMGRS